MGPLRRALLKLLSGLVLGLTITAFNCKQTFRYFVKSGSCKNDLQVSVG